MRRVLGVFCFGLALSWAGTGLSAQESSVEISAEEVRLEAGLPNGRQLNDGTVVGGQPSAEWIEEAAAAGYSTIIDLRGETEDHGFDEPEAVEAAGMRYVTIPIGSAEALDEAAARRFDQELADSDGKAVVHCASGNRVGTLYALRAFFVEGVSVEEALETGRDAGMTSLVTRAEEVMRASGD